MTMDKDTPSSEWTCWLCDGPITDDGRCSVLGEMVCPRCFEAVARYVTKLSGIHMDKSI